MLFAALAAGCGMTPVIKTALHGDLTSLKREIREEQRRGALGEGRVADLAGAVAARELRSAEGASAVRRVRQLRACASALVPALEERAARPDDVGGEAALVLLEEHRISAADAVSRYAESASGAWRAVAARAATGQGDGELRRRFMADPDERVRRAALTAAADARERFDLETLLESARLDPDSLARSLATRAAGAIGGERAVLALVDQWARADDPTRLALVDAWAMPASWASGGERELRALAEGQPSLPSIAAAAALVRLGSGGAGAARAALARAISTGTLAERGLAIRLAPLDDPAVRTALDAAAGDPEPEIQVAAATRQLELPSSRERALALLNALARGEGAAALSARAALASAGRREVRPALLGQLGSKIPDARRRAALGLLALEDWSSAATALGDDDPAVRAAAACAVLTATGRR